MKRFYSTVTVVESEKHGGFVVHLDGKVIKTPDNNPLICPTMSLANKIAEEWREQGDDIVVNDMGLTQFLTTAIDRVRQCRREIEKNTISYLDTDLICYRAQEPEILSQRQKDIWDPWIVWFEKKFDSKLLVTHELVALSQPKSAHDNVATYLKTFDEYRFSVFQSLVALTGSLVLSLAFLDHSITSEDIFRAVNIEEDYKSEIYKEDVHGRAPHADKKREALKKELISSEIFLATL